MFVGALAFNCLILTSCLEVKTLNCDGGEPIVRIRRKLKQQRYCKGKAVYRRHQLELTIPSKFKDVIDPFLNKDLKVEARREGNSIVIEARPVEKTGENV